jgi:uncharacterized membrane protein
VKLFEKNFEKKENSETSLFAAILPFIIIVVGGIISYTIQALLSCLGMQIGFVFTKSILDALVIGPMVGFIAGLGYGAIGLIPATLFFERNKRLSNNTNNNGYLKDLIRAEVMIIFAITIFVAIDLIWQVVYEPVRWEIYFYYFPQNVLKTLVIFGSFPLIGVAVIYGLRYGFKKIKTLSK